LIEPLGRGRVRRQSTLAMQGGPWHAWARGAPVACVRLVEGVRGARSERELGVDTGAAGDLVGAPLRRIRVPLHLERGGGRRARRAGCANGGRCAGHQASDAADEAAGACETHSIQTTTLKTATPARSWPRVSFRIGTTASMFR